MIISREMYESNRIARRHHPCINPRCNNLVEIQNSYDLCIKLLGEAVRVYKKIGYTFEVDLLHGYIRDLTAVMNYSKTQERRDTEAYELLKQGASKKALKVLEDLQR